MQLLTNMISLHRNLTKVQNYLWWSRGFLDSWNRKTLDMAVAVHHPTQPNTIPRNIAAIDSG